MIKHKMLMKSFVYIRNVCMYLSVLELFFSYRAFSFDILIVTWQRLCVRRWNESGVSVRVVTQDASTLAGAKALLKEAAHDGPVGGIFHLAVVSDIKL